MIFIDFEVFKYDWLCCITNMSTEEQLEIVNDPQVLKEYYEKNKNEIWIGYNIKGYDQYILKGILCDFNPYEISKFIIEENNPGYKFSNLFNKINLFIYDVMIRGKSLKLLEGFMGEAIEETQVDFNIDRRLTDDEINKTIFYCRHDVVNTINVFLLTYDRFESTMMLVKEFKLPLLDVGKTEAQLSAKILEAGRVHGRGDAYDLFIPPELKLNKYKEVELWYKNPLNHDEDKKLEIDIAGVPHVFAWGGLHGAIKKYQGEGIYINIDVESYYPALAINYDLLSRNVKDKNKYRKIRDERVILKKQKNPVQKAHKLVLNTAYGATKDKYNNLYDPRQANCICVSGQLLLLDLIEKLEPHCKLIQSNTDGILIKIDKISDYAKIDDICYEWEQRTNLKLEFEDVDKVYQKDVNNYLTIDNAKKSKGKGAYVKVLNELDYDLPIINFAIREYMINGIHPKDYIQSVDNLHLFQKLVRVQGNYSHAEFDNIMLPGKTHRVFASNDTTASGIYKVKKGKDKGEKFANTPDHCFIYNGRVTNKSVPDNLDKAWYIDLTIERLNQFGVEV